MIITELAPVSSERLPLAEFRDHLRLGTGFSDDATQDGLLEAQLRAAVAAIEAKTGKALFSRAFSWRLSGWRGFHSEELPWAPVTEITSVTITEADGDQTLVPSTAYVLQEDAQHPTIAARGLSLPTIPVSGNVSIVFVAGFASDWDGLPPVLRQAVLVLAAEFHEHRQGPGDDPMSTRVLQLIAPYRPVRLFRRRSR